MEFKILGPLEAREGERVLACKGAKQRLLLGVLLLHANEVVSSDRLGEALWGERPPATGSKALQMHVSELRDLLEPERARGRPGRMLVTRPPGYELRVEEGQLDLQRFEHAVDEARAAARAGLPRQAADGLRAARHWRIWATRTSSKRISPGSKNSGSGRWRTGSTPISPSNVTRSCPPSSRASS